jgi:hypothetical protein
MTSSYQQLKLYVLSVVPLPKDALHIYVGFFCLLGALVLLRRRLSSFSALLPGLAVSVAMELLDLRDHLREHGRPLWGSHVHDLVNTNLLPFLLVAAARLRQVRL